MLFAFLPLWPTVAVGVGAISIPIIIHLLNQRRFQIVEWAAMKFLLAAQKQTRKRVRIEQLLLLLVRILIVALLVFAMASIMPWAEDIWHAMGLGEMVPATRTHKVHHIFVLDCSLSNNQAAGDQSAFEVGRQLVLKKIQDNPVGDAYSVLLLKENPIWLVGETSLDAKKVIREIEQVKATHGNSSLPSALGMVSAKLNENNVRFKHAQAVYFVTDMQRSTWLAAAPTDQKTDGGRDRTPYLEISKHASTFFLDTGRDGGVNLAVTHVEFKRPYLTVNTELPLSAMIKNFSQEAKKTRVEMLVGKAKEGPNAAAVQPRPVDEKDVTIAAGETHTVDFNRYKFPEAGTYVVQVRIGEDALLEDNVRTVIVTVRKTIDILVVNGKNSNDRFERATEYLRLSLNPFPVGAEPKEWPVRPKVISPSQFKDMKDEELEHYDAVWWCDVGEFDNVHVRKVDAHLRRGGGFIVALGDNALKAIGDYNTLLFKKEQGLLPASLGDKVKAPADHHFYFQNADDDAFSSVPLKEFSDEQDRLTLRTARFRQYVKATMSEGKARVLLSFMPEALASDKVKRDDTLPVNLPAIIEWSPLLPKAQQPDDKPAKGAAKTEKQPSRYRGKVILITTAVNMDWSTWPGSPSFGAMMHELTRFSFSARLRERATNVGGLLETYLPGINELDVVLHFPNNAKKSEKYKTLVFDDANLFRSADTDYAGVYRVETASGHEVPFAVNVPVASSDQKSEESNLLRLDAQALKDLYPGWEFRVVRELINITLGGPAAQDEDSPTMINQPVGPTLAGVALLLVMGLVFAEVILAWLFGHYSTTEGAESRPASAGLVTLLILALVAVVGVSIFGAVATIIYHFHETRDFLGFLPEFLRRWFEGDNVEHGEGRRWTLGTGHPVLFGMPAENWWMIGITLTAAATIFFIYLKEARKAATTGFMLLMATVMLVFFLTVQWFLAPQYYLQYEREGHPDLVLLIDDSRSMGEPDVFQDAKVIERVKVLTDAIREKLTTELPARITAIENEIAAKSPDAAKPEVKDEIDGLRQRLQYWHKQKENIDQNKWRPSRLQLVQAILTQKEPHWLKTLLTKKSTKVHVFHLDGHGRAAKLMDTNGDAGELLGGDDQKAIERTLKAIADLEPVGNDSRLGKSVREIIDQYRGANLYSIVMFTDGVTTREETIGQVSDYAAQKGIPLFFVGIGDEGDRRDLKLQDMQVEDQIYLGDKALFEVSLIGLGYKDLVVPVVLKVRDIDKNGKEGPEREVPGQRELKKVDPTGKAVKIRFRDQPKALGRKKYIIEVEPPKLQGNEKPLPQANLRLERIVEVIDTKMIKVLYVEGQPRYEFRYIKFLLERESPDKDKKKSIDLKVVLLDADDQFAEMDKTALTNFPPTLEELSAYDVLIFGDCDPNHKKIKDRLKDIASFARGEDEKGKKGPKAGGGVLFMAGAFHNPHSYKGTPLADIIPVQPLQDKAPPEVPRRDPMRPELTQSGRMHPIFRFTPNEGENAEIWEGLQPMFWNSSRYKIAPLAEVLATHRNDNAEQPRAGQPGKHPLVVQQYVGSGRSMFFGFDETWRWRKQEGEAKFNMFWIQTMRYLSRGRTTRTDLRLDRQTPYKMGEPIKITVRFPDSSPGGGANPDGPKVTDKTEVKVAVTYLPPDAKDEKDVPVEKGESTNITLTKIEGSGGTYEGTWTRTREGKYGFMLLTPDVKSTQPDKLQPSAQAVVERPPGELERLRLNYQELIQAADATQGRFYTLAKADEVLDDLPSPPIITVPTLQPPDPKWNKWYVLLFLITLITCVWIMRKTRHLL
jgi:uncharacterized membrane protein